MSDNINNIEEKSRPAERTVINTGKTKYSFTDSWVENDALKDILVGMISDDLKEI